MRAAACRILLPPVPPHMASPHTFNAGAGFFAPVVLVAVRGNTPRGAGTFAAALCIHLPLMPHRLQDGIPTLKTQKEKCSGPRSLASFSLAGPRRRRPSATGLPPPPPEKSVRNRRASGIRPRSSGRMFGLLAKKSGGSGLAATALSSPTSLSTRSYRGCSLGASLGFLRRPHFPGGRTNHHKFSSVATLFQDCSAR